MNDNTTKSVQEISALSFPIPWILQSIEKELTNKFARYVTLKMDDTVIGFVECGLFLKKSTYN